jgi:hypothetical protein
MALVEERAKTVARAGAARAGHARAGFCPVDTKDPDNPQNEGPHYTWDEEALPTTVWTTEVSPSGE